MAYKPEAPELYQGNQVLINSDRLVFNAKTDGILLFSDKVIGFSTNGSFHFDTSKNTDNKFILKCCVKNNTKKIPESAMATFLPIEEDINVIKIMFILQN